jgi:hypothetical protein
MGSSACGIEHGFDLRRTGRAEGRKIEFLIS